MKPTDSIDMKVFMAVQRHELNRHGYFLSEKAGRALLSVEVTSDWCHLFAEQFREMYFAHQEKLEDTFRPYAKKLDDIDESILRSIIGEWNTIPLKTVIESAHYEKTT